jgi:hypothetical protein
MCKFDFYQLEESFERFERAAAKGHEQSIWISSVVKGVEMKGNALREAFAKTEKPMGWHFAGRLSNGRERFDFYKKSAEGGCSWGQAAYARYFEFGRNFVKQDVEVYVEWLEKAANQNNPEAMHLLGEWFRNEEEDEEMGFTYHRAGAELGWGSSIFSWAEMLKEGEGCAPDLRQAVLAGATGGFYSVFWKVLSGARQAFEAGTTENLDYNFNQICYSFGWGFYWYQYESKGWHQQIDEDKAFGERCLDFYCSCVELQQKSIFTFLLGWNRAPGGVKDVGAMIGKMVWEGRADNLVETFEESGGEEPETM